MRKTLGEYIQLKGSSLLDIIKYAKTKDLEIPEDENYTLAESELKLIDPILSFSFNTMPEKQSRLFA